MMRSPTGNRPRGYSYRPNDFDDMDPFSMQGIIEEQRLQEQESSAQVVRSKLPLRIRNLLSQKRDGIPRVITFISSPDIVEVEGDDSEDLPHVGMVIEVLHDDEGVEPRRNHQRQRSRSCDGELCHINYDKRSFNSSMSSNRIHTKSPLDKITSLECRPESCNQSKEHFKSRHHANQRTHSRDYCEGSISSLHTSYPYSQHSSAISMLHKSISQQSVAGSSRPRMSSAKPSSERSLSPKSTLHSRSSSSAEHCLSHDDTNSFKSNSPLYASYSPGLTQLQKSNSERQLRRPHSSDPFTSLQLASPNSCVTRSCLRLQPSDPTTLVMSASCHTRTQQQDKRQYQHATHLAKQSSTCVEYKIPTQQDPSQIPRISTLTFIDSMFASKSLHPRALQGKKESYAS